MNEIDLASHNYVVTRNGRPVAVVVDYDWYTALAETLETLSDPGATMAIADGGGPPERPGTLDGGGGGSGIPAPSGVSPSPLHFGRLS